MLSCRFPRDRRGVRSRQKAYYHTKSHLRHSGLIGKRLDSSASGKIKSDCFLPHRCIQRRRSFSTNEILWNLHSHFMFTGISINPSSEFRSKIQLEVEILVVHRLRTFLVNLDAKERYSLRFGLILWFLNGGSSGILGASQLPSEKSIERLAVSLERDL